MRAALACQWHARQFVPGGLDIGCGSQPCRGLFAVNEYLGHGSPAFQHRKLLADCPVLFQWLNADVSQVRRTRSMALNMKTTALLPGNPDLFLDQFVVAERRP